MARNKISDLRDHLFATLEALADPKKPMDLARAKTIAEVAQTIINSAKVEVDATKAVCGSALATNFFGVQPEHPLLPVKLNGGVTETDAFKRRAI